MERAIGPGPITLGIDRVPGAGPQMQRRFLVEFAGAAYRTGRVRLAQPKACKRHAGLACDRVNDCGQDRAAVSAAQRWRG